MGSGFNFSKSYSDNILPHQRFPLFMKKLILFSLLVLAWQNILAQNVKQLYYGSDIIVEGPVTYTFRAGTESITKTVTVKVSITDFRVEYNDIAQYIEGGGMMGGFKYDLSFTRWYKRGDITSIMVDGISIPISDFTDNGNAGPIIFTDISFSWWQKSYPVKRWNLGGLSFRAELENAEKRIGLSTDYYELKDFLGTQTNKDAEENLKANGPIFARDLTFGEVKYYPSPKIGSYLAKRDAQIAIETGFYTNNGFRNPVKQPTSTSTSNSGGSTGSNSSSGSSSSTGSTQTTSTNTNTGSSQTAAQERRQREKERQDRIDANAEAIAVGAVAVASILSDVLPEPSFFIGDVGISLSGNNQYYAFQVGFGYKLTPEDMYPTAALGIGYVAGIMVSDVNWMITLRKSRTNYDDPVEFYSDTFDKLKPAVFMGFGGNFYSDTPWKNKAFHVSGFWGAGSITYPNSIDRDDLLSRSNSEDKEELVLITNIKAEIVNFINKSKGISFGIGYEKNIFNYQDGIGGGTIRKNGLLVHVGFVWM